MKYFYRYFFGMLSFTLLMGCASNTVKKELDNDKEKFVYVKYEPSTPDEPSTKYEPSKTYVVSPDFAHGYDMNNPNDPINIARKQRVDSEKQQEMENINRSRIIDCNRRNIDPSECSQTMQGY